MMERNGQRVAHGGVWPLWILTGEGETAGLHVIDWAAPPSAAGAGDVPLEGVTQTRCVYLLGRLGPASGFRQCQPINMDVNNS